MKIKIPDKVESCHAKADAKRRVYTARQRGGSCSILVRTTP